MTVFGVWMWPGSIEKNGARETVWRCALSGVTDIYFLAKGLNGTVSFKSSAAPQSGEGDLMGGLLSAAHEKGIRVHAWFTSAADEHYKSQHPESGRCHYKRGRDRGLISLTDEGYLAYMLRVLKEVLAGYDIDGVHLDYIRYNHLTYGWDENDRKRYAGAGANMERVSALMEKTFFRGENGGENAIFDALREGDESVRAVAAVRRRDVARFAGELISLVRAERPRVTVSAALMPEGAYDDTAFADLHYGQSYEDAARLYDHALPMAYSRAYGQDSAWVRRVADGARRKNVKTVMGLQAYEDGTGETLINDIAALRGAETEGICLFREGAFALVRRGEGRAWLYDPLSVPVTALSADGVCIPLTDPVLPGEEKPVPPLPQGARLRAFSGDKEVCVYLTGSEALLRT